MFSKTPQRLFALLLLCLAAVPAFAADWQVAKLAGRVWIITVDGERTRAAVGMTLPANATVATLGGSRVMLRHAKDILNVGPNTQLAPQARRIRGLTTVLMRKGDVDLDIEQLGRPHFSVQTPFLAAVVKGTRFSVSVVGRRAEVSVDRGRVEVTSLATGQAADVVGGQAARVAETGLSLSGAGTLPEVRSVPPQAPVVEAAVEARGSGPGSVGNARSASVANAASAVAAGSSRGKSGNSNAGGNSGNSNAGGNSGNSNAGGNSANSNAGGNGANSNAGGNGNGRGNSN